jgi:ABC-type multidrug transport system fused ATPase/permease subunit
MKSRNPQPTGFRWRPLRLRRATWPGDDAGPLSVTEPGGARRWIEFGWRRYIAAPDDPRAPDLVISMPYPTARGPLTPGAWTATWHTVPSLLKRGVLALANAAAMLPWFSPALLALAGGTRNTVMAAGGLAISGLLLRHAAAMDALDCNRTDSTGVHGRLWDRLLALPSSIYTRVPSRLVADVDQAIRGALALASLRRRALAPAIALGATLALVGSISTMVAAGTALGLTAFAAIVWRLVGRQIRCARSAAIAMAAFNREVGFVARHLPRLHDLGVAQARKTQLQDLAAAAGDAADVAKRAEDAVGAARHLGMAAGAVVVILLPPWLTVLMTPQQAFGVLLLTPAAVTAAATLATLFGQRSEQLRSIASIDDLLRFDVDPDGGAYGQLQKLSLRAVAYRHSSGPLVLRDIDLALRRGEVLALSGASGAGKSTLLRIVMGLADPSAGEVVVDGRLLRAAHAASYRARIAAVFQNEDIGFATVRNAVSSGRPGIGLEQISDALADVGLLEEILALPMGLQTLVIAGSFPQNFCHRLMIARSLAADADLLVFDETLTDLDPAVVLRILDAARRRGAAVIFSTHKPALLEFADRVIRLPPRPQRGAGGTAISDTQ